MIKIPQTKNVKTVTTVTFFFNPVKISFDNAWDISEEELIKLAEDELYNQPFTPSYSDVEIDDDFIGE